MSKKSKDSKQHQPSENNPNDEPKVDQTIDDENLISEEELPTETANEIEEHATDQQIDEDPQPESPAEEPSEAPQVIVKKGSSVLALLLSLLALGGCGYLFYLKYVAPQNDQTQQQMAAIDKQSQSLEQNLNQLDNKFSAQLQKLQQQLQQQAATITQLQTTSTQQTTQPTTEQLLDRFAEQSELETLQQQLTEQQQKLKQLKNSWQQTTNSVQPTANQDFRQQTQELNQLLDRNRLLNKLYVIKNLLQIKDFEQAQQQLEQVTQQLPATVKNQAEQLLQRWQTVQQPNLAAIQKQLNKAKKKASKLSLQVEQQQAKEQEKEAWYNRFVSIKKIDQKNNLENSNQLQLLKIQITQNLLQAEWSLTLQQQQNWQRQLNQAANLLTQKMPYEQQLQQLLRNLSKQSIAVNPLPSEPLDQIIEQLKSVMP